MIFTYNDYEHLIWTKKLLEKALRKVLNLDEDTMILFILKRGERYYLYDERGYLIQIFADIEKARSFVDECFRNCGIKVHVIDLTDEE